MKYSRRVAHMNTLPCIIQNSHHPKPSIGSADPSWLGRDVLFDKMLFALIFVRGRIVLNLIFVAI